MPQVSSGRARPNQCTPWILAWARR